MLELELEMPFDGNDYNKKNKYRYSLANDILGIKKCRTKLILTQCAGTSC